MPTEPTANAPVYLDYAATAPVEPRVAARMAEVLAMPPGNAAASHAAGRAAHALIELARGQVAALVGAPPADIVFTSGATESNNLAITGTARAALARGERPHLITLATEHKAVLEPVRALQSQGAAISILRPDAQGLLDPAVLAAAIRPETRLVCLLHVNNETGVLQDIPAIARLCAARGVPLHVDAAQGAGKVPLALDGIAMLSITAHKLGGPQGIGALYVAPAHRAALQPQLVGGGQERGLRAGTLATHQIAGFGLACQIAAERRAGEALRLAALREQLWSGLGDLPGVLLNGHPTARAPGILNVTFAGVEGESLYTGLPGLTLSTGSACNSRSGEPSFVLRALGRDTEQAQSSLRFSFGYATTTGDIEAAIAAVRQVHAMLWGESPARGLAAEWLPGNSAGWQTGEAGAQRLGTWVRFAALAAGGTVTAARAQVYGCPHTAAVCSRLVAEMPGRPLAAPAAGSPEDWRVAVGAPVEKLGRMLIIEDALGALSTAQH
jgi:cysteine desulfurase